MVVVYQHRSPLTDKQMKISLVVNDEDASIIVGFRVIVKNVIISIHRLHCHLKFQFFPTSILSVSCYQLTGHLLNYGKQIYILTGQASCSVAYPVPCCMVNKDSLWKPPEWICQRHRRSACSLPASFADNVVDLISQWVCKLILTHQQERVNTASNLHMLSRADWVWVCAIKWVEKSIARPIRRLDLQSMSQSSTSHAESKTVG